MPEDIQKLRQDFQEHSHTGNDSSQVDTEDIFGEFPSNLNTEGQTIATTGNTDWFVIVSIGGRLSSADFSGTDALAANDTNFITFTITNLGRAGGGSTALLGTDTTQATGGTAIGADTVRELILSTTVNATAVVAGERLRIRAAVTNTLANSVTNSVFILRFQ